MPVIATLRRHTHTKKVDGKRIVGFTNAKKAVIAGRKLRATNAGLTVKSYASPVERAQIGARASNPATRGKIITPKVSRMRLALRNELNLGKFFVNEKAAMDMIGTKFGGSEIAARNAWLNGYNFEGTVLPAKPMADGIIRHRFGLAIAAAGGKARKRIDNILLDNVSHSWFVEAVVKELTHGMHNAPKMEKLVPENEGLRLELIRQPSGKLKAHLTYEEFSGDVTRNLATIVSPNVRKYLEA